MWCANGQLFRLPQKNQVICFICFELSITTPHKIASLGAVAQKLLSEPREIEVRPRFSVAENHPLTDGARLIK
jgi:hypothetical protein